MSPYVGRPVLACFLTCAFGQQAELLSDDEVVAGCIEQMRRAFGAMISKNQSTHVFASGHSSIPSPIAHLVTRWNSDPFAYGAYSHFASGSSKRHTDALATSCGNLYWAGEHTSHINLGTVAGAWANGLDAANNILKAITAEKKAQRAAATGR
jgi:monoamine oxidase